MRARLILGPVAKAIRRQKEKRLIGAGKIFFKDGSTKLGRQRMDRALSSIYGYKTPLRPSRSIGLRQAVRKYHIKGTKKIYAAKIAKVDKALKSIKQRRSQLFQFNFGLGGKKYI
jgi:hypothetical protein